MCGVVSETNPTLNAPINDMKVWMNIEKPYLPCLLNIGEKQ